MDWLDDDPMTLTPEVMDVSGLASGEYVQMRIDDLDAFEFWSTGSDNLVVLL